MRNLAVVLTMCLLVSLAGCMDGNAWVYGNPESKGMMGTRLGLEVLENIEVGGSINYSPGESTTTVTRSKSRKARNRHLKTITHEHEDDWTYGAHLIGHWPNAIGPVSLYGGGQVNIGEGTWDVIDTLQPIGGASIGPVFAEYQHKTTYDERDKYLFGIKIEW